MRIIPAPLDRPGAPTSSQPGPERATARRLRRARVAHLTATATLCAGAAVAQAPVPLQDIVVSANRAPTLAERTGSAVSVITAETFEEDGRPFALDFLTEQPGVTVAQNGPPGTVSGFAVRGAPQQYVRVQIDGIEISDPTGPQVAPSLSGLLVDELARIEVLRGSQSAIYGGQAVGGVIDITTRRATEDGFEARYRLEGGSFATFRGNLGLAGRDERGEFALNLTRFQTDGFSAAEEADGNTEDDGFDTTQLSASGTFYATEVLSLFGSGFWQRSDGDFDAGAGAGQDAPNTFDTESWGLRGGADFALLDGRLSNRVAVSYYSIDRTQRSVFGDFVTDGSRTKAEYIGRYGVSETLGLQFGADWTRETSESNFSDEEENTVVGVFGQADWSPVEPLTVNAALRYDAHSEFGGYTTGRLTAAYVLPTETVVRGALGTGFRAPSNFELFDAFSGNPDLDPETSRSADLGVEQSFAGGRGRASATLFWLEIDDLIEFDTATFVYFQTDGTAESRGLELAGAWDFTDRLTLSGAYTYTDATLPDGDRRLRIPRHALSVTLDGTVRERWSLGLAANLVADLPDEPDVESAGFAEDYVVVSARVGYALTEAADLYLRAENLFDAQYQTAEGFSTADRSVYFGVSGRF